jgi:hypothetical protein
MHFIWLSIDNYPPSNFQIAPIRQGLIYFNHLRNGTIAEGVKTYFSLHICGGYYSTIYGGLYFLFYCLFGVAHDMDLMFNAIFLVLGMIGMYASGTLLFNKRTGIVSATLWSALPPIIGFSKMIHYEYLLTCFLPLMIFFWLKSDCFRSLRSSLIFGIILGVMGGIKPQGLVFALAPFGQLLFCVAQQTRGKQTEILRQLRNAVIAGCAGTIIGLHWYVLNWRSFYDLYMHRFEPGEDLRFFLNVSIPYLDFGPQWMNRIFIVIMFIVGVCLCIKRFRNLTVNKIAYLVFMLIVPLFLMQQFFSGVHYLHEHVITLTPFIVLIMCGGIELLAMGGAQRSRKEIKAAAIPLNRAAGVFKPQPILNIFMHGCQWCITICLIFYGLCMHCIPLLDESSLIMFDRCLQKISGRLNHFIFLPYRSPQRNNWAQRIAEMADRIIEDREVSRGTRPFSEFRVFFLTLSEPLYAAQLEACFLKRNIAATIDNGYIVRTVSEATVMDCMGGYEYFIQLTPLVHDDPSIKILIIMNHILEKDETNFKILERLNVGEGQTLTLYKRIGDKI